MSTSMGAPEVVVSLGTDHHHFDRMVEWFDLWLAGHPDPPSCLVQHGATRAPRFARGVPLMPRGQLLELFRQARVVVVQGGPGSILDAREVGKIPIAVPRMPNLNEVVDIHQLEFTKVMVARGEATMAQTMDEMLALMEAGLRDPRLVNGVPRKSAAPQAAKALDRALHERLARPTGALSLRRVRQMWAA